MIYILCVVFFSVPARAKTAVGRDGTSDIKTMYLLQCVAIHLNCQDPLFPSPHCHFHFLTPSLYPPFVLVSSPSGSFALYTSPRLFEITCEDYQESWWVGRPFAVQPTVCSLDVTSLNVYVSRLSFNRPASPPERLMTCCFLISSTTELGCQ